MAYVENTNSIKKYIYNNDIALTDKETVKLSDRFIRNEQRIIAHRGTKKFPTHCYKNLPEELAKVQRLYFSQSKEDEMIHEVEIQERYVNMEEEEALEQSKIQKERDRSKQAQEILDSGITMPDGVNPFSAEGKAIVQSNAYQHKGGVNAYLQDQRKAKISTDENEKYQKINDIMNKNIQKVEEQVLNLSKGDLIRDYLPKNFNFLRKEILKDLGDVTEEELDTIIARYKTEFADRLGRGFRSAIARDSVNKLREDDIEEGEEELEGKGEGAGAKGIPMKGIPSGEAAEAPKKKPKKKKKDIVPFEKPEPEEGDDEKIIIKVKKIVPAPTDTEPDKKKEVLVDKEITVGENKLRLAQSKFSKSDSINRLEEISFKTKGATPKGAVKVIDASNNIKIIEKDTLKDGVVKAGTKEISFDVYYSKRITDFSFKKGETVDLSRYKGKRNIFIARGTIPTVDLPGTGSTMSKQNSYYVLQAKKGGFKILNSINQTVGNAIFKSRTKPK
jgi:hypothetical protein